MRSSDWSSDVCSSDLHAIGVARHAVGKGRLDLGRQQRKGVRRVIALVAVVIDREPEPVDHRRRPVKPQLEIAMLFGEPEGIAAGGRRDRKRVVEGKSVSVRLDLGGGRIITKKK